MNYVIRISKKQKNWLDRKKLSEKDSYVDVLDYIMENDMELTEEFKKELDEADKQSKQNETVTHEELKRRLGFLNAQDRVYKKGRKKD